MGYIGILHLFFLITILSFLRFPFQGDFWAKWPTLRTRSKESCSKRTLLALSLWISLVGLIAGLWATYNNAFPGRSIKSTMDDISTSQHCTLLQQLCEKSKNLIRELDNRCIVDLFNILSCSARICPSLIFEFEQYN